MTLPAALRPHEDATHPVATKLSSRTFERILLIKPSALGDVVHTLPLLAKLRRRYPAAQIDWMLNPRLAELIREHPALSRIVPFDRQRYARWVQPVEATTGLRDLLLTLRRGRYDLVIDLHGQLRSAVCTLVTGARTRIGFPRPRRRWDAERPRPRSAYKHGWTGAREGAWVVYTHYIPVPTLETHAVDRYLRLGPMLGLDDDPPQFYVPIPVAARQRADELLRAHGLADRPFALLAPGTIWETKHWRAEGFADVARHFAGRGWAVVLAGSPRERDCCAAVAAMANGTIDLCGQTTIGTLAALIQRAEIAVTNDSGPMHLAVALGRPVVSVFGPTDADWIGPYRRPGAVARADLPCAPCYLRKLSRCRHDHACMRQVSAAEVIERAERALTIVGLRRPAHPAQTTRVGPASRRPMDYNPRYE